MSDWTSHPLPSRLHFIFDRLAVNHRVHVLGFKIGRFDGTTSRATKAIVHEATMIPASDLSAYYLLNASYHYERISQIISEQKIDVIVAANILASSAAFIAARRFGIPSVYDYLDHFPDSAALYYKNPGMKRLVRTSVEAVVKENLKFADKTVVVSRSLLNMMKADYGVAARKLTLIPNGVDVDVFRPCKRTDALLKIGRSDLDSDFLLVFVGSVESRFDLETPIRAVIRLTSEGMKIKLLIVGPGLSRYHFELRQKYSEFPCIEFVGYVSDELLPYYVNIANICLAAYRPMLMNFSITLKMLQYLSCGKVTFMSRIPDAKRVFGDVVVEYGDVDELVKKVRDVYDDFGYYSSIGEEGRKIASEYSWTNIASTYESLLHTLVENR